MGVCLYVCVLITYDYRKVREKQNEPKLLLLLLFHRLLKKNLSGNTYMAQQCYRTVKSNTDYNYKCTWIKKYAVPFYNVSNQCYI